MRKLSIALLTACSIGLGSCSTTTPSDITAIITQVQKDAVAICGFLPTVGTVASIISGGNPLITTALGIAQAICNAVTPAPSALRKKAVVPMVNGVVIHGRFVR